MDAIIHSLSWHIKTKNQQRHAVEVQQEASELSNSASFLQILEASLNQILPDGAYYSIQKLEIDLGKLPAKTWLNEAKIRLPKALEKALIAAKETSENNNKQLRVASVQTHVSALFKDFVTTGNLPKQLPANIYTVNDVAHWFATQMASKELQSNLAKLLKSDKNLAIALAKWPLKGLFQSITKKLTQAPKSAHWFVVVEDLLTVSQEKTVTEAAKFRVLAWQYLLADEGSRNAFFAEAKKLIGNLAHAVLPQNREKFRLILQNLEKTKSVLPTMPNEKSTEFELELTATPKQEAKHENTFYIRNAGLVLVAPFLPTYLAQLGFLKQNIITKPEKALRSLALLDVDDAREFGADMLLYKMLLGLPVHQLILPALRISTKQRHEAQNLLTEIIKHWSVLKNSSPASLRSGFFWREGSLKELPGRWELTVETKAQDLLLAHLPWGIGIIKLPWMSKPLHVNWG